MAEIRDGQGTGSGGDPLFAEAARGRVARGQGGKGGDVVVVGMVRLLRFVADGGGGVAKVVKMQGGGVGG